MGDAAAVFSSLLQNTLCSGVSSNLTYCILQRGGALPLFIIGLFLVLLVAAFANAAKEGTKRVPIFLFAGILTFISVAIVPSLLGLVLAATAIISWFIFGEPLSHYRARVRHNLTIRLDIFVLLLAPFLFALGVGSEVFWYRFFPQVAPPPAIFVLPSQDFPGKHAMPAAQKIYFASRDYLVPIFGSERIFPGVQKLKVESKDFNNFWIAYGRSWGDISRLIKDEYADAANRDLELIRGDIIGITDERVSLSIAWAFRDRHTGKTVAVHTTGWWFTATFDEILPMVIVADFLVAKVLSNRPNMQLSESNNLAFSTKLHQEVLSALQRAYRMDPPADIPSAIRESLIDPDSCSTTRCLDDVINTLKDRFSLRNVKVDQKDAKRVEENQRTAQTYYQATKGVSGGL